MSNSILLLCVLFFLYGAVFIRYLKEQGCFKAGEGEWKTLTREAVFVRSIWGNAFILSFVVGSVLNLNAAFARKCESFNDFLVYFQSCPDAVITFYLIPFMVSSATAFLSRCGKGCLFSLFFATLSGRREEK